MQHKALNFMCNAEFKNAKIYKEFHLGVRFFHRHFRYNVGRKMVARTIKPVKAGDIIYENYGPLFTRQSKKERQSFLLQRYWFECLCQPCVELWPTFEEMDENMVRIPCKNKKCPKVFELSKDIECPFLSCNICKESTSVFPYLKGLMVSVLA